MGLNICLEVGGNNMPQVKSQEDIPDYMLNGDSAGGGLGGTYPNPTVTAVTSNARIYTGTYSGDGNATQAITGIGFLPKYVKLGKKYGSESAPRETIYAVDSMDSGYSITDYGSADGHDRYDNDQGRIVSFDSDGFTVGGPSTTPGANANGVTYWYVAIG